MCLFCAGPPVALARLAPLKLPWLVTEEDLSHPVVKDAPMPAAQEPQQEQAVPKEDAAAAAGTQECGSAPSSTQPPVVPRVVLADGRKGGGSTNAECIRTWVLIVQADCAVVVA
jgi:hypothetical protein